jgi:phenylalanyl-tRNA synthetase beta chain
VANPLSEKFAVLRPSLVPGLVDALIRNRRREHRDIRLFEIGHRFRRTGGESTGVAIALTGAGTREHWSGRARASDLFDIKGIVERLADAGGVTVRIEPTSRPELVPGRAAIVRSERAESAEVCTLGFLGQLLPSLATARGLPIAGDDVYVAELDLDMLGEVAVDRAAMRVTPLPRHPSIVRDLAIVVDASLPAATVRGTIRAVASETLIDVREFDRYAGKGVPEGRLSLAFRLTFRHPDRTLTDAEVQQTMDAIVTNLESTHQASLR